MFLFPVGPLTVRIMKTEEPLVADRRYEVSCESTGSRPAAIITWYKGKRQLKRTKVSQQVQLNLFFEYFLQKCETKHMVDIFFFVTT